MYKLDTEGKTKDQLQAEGIVLIHGKAYATVARRVADFREIYPDYPLTTEIVHMDMDNCVIKASIADPSGQVLSTGLAHEVKGAGNINRTSHIENAETSAVGRALAFFGMAGTEIASADEVANAINQQAQMDTALYDKWSKKVQTLEGVLEFMRLDQELQVEIANAAPQGQKTKWKEVLRGQEKSAHTQLDSYADDLKSVVESGDEGNIRVSWGEFSDNEKRFLWARLNGPEQTAIQEAMKHE